MALEILVNDQVGNVSERALEVNGLDLPSIRYEGWDVVDAAEAVSAFISKVRKKTGSSSLYSVGHNVAFDTAYMRRLFHLAEERCPKEFSFNRSIDTHAMLYLRGDPTSLDRALKKYDIPYGLGRHTALADAKLTATLYWRLTE